MFNFTTQTVYNNISTTGANKNMWVVSGKKPALRIGNTRFDQNQILDIQMKNPTKEALASVTFGIEQLTAALNNKFGDGADVGSEVTGRIVLYIGLSMNSQDSFYANDFVYKGKPFYIEFPINLKDIGSTFEKIKYIAEKYLLLQAQEKLLNIEAVDDQSVTISGVNGYQQIKKALFQVFDPNAKSVDCCSNQGEYVTILTGVPVGYTVDEYGETVTLIPEELEELGDDKVAIAPGLEAFGDYNWIIHNLRLPTAANTGFWSPARHEMPVPGQEYTQFIVRMKVERDGIMGEIVGARGTSVTTHVFYVAGRASVANTPANKVKTELAKLGTIQTTADTVLQNPYHNN